MAAFKPLVEAWGHFAKNCSGPRRKPRVLGRSSCCEPLESRRLLATTALVTDLGTLNPSGGRRLVRNGENVPGPSLGNLHIYNFSLQRKADVKITAERISGVLNTDVDMNLVGIEDTFDQDSDDDDIISKTLPAGNYELDVTSESLLDAGFDLVINVDEAPGNFAFDGAGGLRADLGRDIGTLPVFDSSSSTSTTPTFFDAVGYLYNSFRNTHDELVDTYLFDVPSNGSVKATVDQIVSPDNVTGGTVSVNFGFYKDTNHDDVFSANELIAGKTALTSSGTSTVTPESGEYALVVSHTLDSGSTMSASNYRLRFTYTPTDNAGNTQAAARDIGTLTEQTQTFSDFITNDDPIDYYKFSTVTGGPFAFTATLSGLDQDFSSQLIVRDSAGNFVGSSTGPSGTRTLTAGTYYFEVLQSSGQSPYTLKLSSRNNDLAGNGLIQANNIGELQGKVQFSDFVSSTDTADFFRFNVTHSGTVRASTGSTISGTDCDLFLYDAGGNLVRSSQTSGTSGESVAAAVGTGTFYVGVVRRDGSPRYDLSISLETAGSFTSTARDMALTPSGDYTTVEYVGPEDTLDVYHVTTTGALQLNVFFSSVNETMVVRISQDLNGDHALATSEAFFTKTVRTLSGGKIVQTSAERVAVNLSTAGEYYVSVSFAGTSGDNYGITFAKAPVDSAGNTTALAADLGVLGNPGAVRSDFIGDGSIDAADDFDDFYHFTVGTNGKYVFVGQTTSVANGGVIVQLMNNVDLHGQGTVLGTVSSPLSGIPPVPLVVTLTDPGDYYVHVLRSTGNPSYTLSMLAGSLDGAGNTFATARPLGALNTTLSTSDFVGRIDSDDYYSFTLASPGELQAQLSGGATPASIQLILDANGNGAIDGADLLGSTTGLTTSNDLLVGAVAPVAGTYFARVLAGGADSNYTLGLTYSTQLPFGSSAIAIGNTTPVTIQCEDFDRGGEGVAYHDTTSSNAGGVYRTTENGADIRVDIFPTADSGGGFLIDNTAAGEFLEYSINVAVAGSYNFAYRAGTTGSGATFHAEIDGANISGAKDVPGGLPADTMATVTTSNVFLTGGPHILRLRMDTANTSGPAGAGAFNFITISPSTGTFVLSPPQSSVHVGQATSLSLKWTVPTDDWHVLDAIDVRLRDADGIVAWMRFYEADKTVSLYNPHSGKFGPAKKVGSNGTLANGDISLDLSTTAITGGGPTATDVTLTVGLTFLGSTRGRHLVVEAAASNDSGFMQDFELAGIVDVLDH